MRALITGVSGQDGRYLGELLHSKGYEVFGLVHDLNGHAAPETVAQEIPGVTLLRGDITQRDSLAAALVEAQPDEIYNFAALSFVASSWSDADRAFEITAKGVYNLLEETRRWAGADLDRVRYYQASTSEVFGHAEESPQSELSAFRPRSPYGVAKVFGHHCTVNYREKYGLHATNGILFNHESPRRGTEFVTRKVSQGVARISLGLQEHISLGNLDARRDWGFAGDYVQAMWLMTQQAHPDDYVVATGVTHSIRDLLETAFAEIGVDDWTAYVREDPRYMRPAESVQLVGDASKARSELGWQPTVTFQELVRMMVRSDIAEASIQT